MSILQPMFRSVPTRLWHLRRAKAFLLLAVFLSAGTSLPGPDALLYHNGVTELDRSQSHIEPAGGCLDHAGHCVLGRTASGSGAVVTLVRGVRVEPTNRPAPARLPAVPHTQADRGTVPQPRAPPAPIV
jgi:hypothetical protein